MKIELTKLNKIMIKDSSYINQLKLNCEIDYYWRENNIDLFDVFIFENRIDILRFQLIANFIKWVKK